MSADSGEWKPRPWLAALLNFWGGLGHLYAGRPLIAVAIPPLLLIWLTTLILVSCYVSSPWARLACVALFIVSRMVVLPVWGYLAARRTAPAPKRGFQRWYALAAYTVAVLVLVLVYAGKVAPRWISWYRVPTQSMEPTLRLNDLLVASVDGDELQREDVVLATGRETGQLFFRRIIALPGDRVELRNFRAYINGQPEEPAFGPCRPSPLEHLGQYGPVLVPEGQYALFGDCRDNAVDVRFLGFTPRAGIYKHRMWILWSSDSSRIGRAVR